MLKAEKEMTLKQLREMLESNMHADKISVTKKRITVKKGYFYTFGYSSNKLAEKVRTLLEEHKVSFFSIEDEDHWNAWPKDSFFKVIVTR